MFNPGAAAPLTSTGDAPREHLAGAAALALARTEAPRPAEALSQLDALMVQACATLGRPARLFEADAAALLAALPWDGCVAEPRTIVARLAENGSRPTIALDEVVRAIIACGCALLAPSLPLREATRRFERRYIVAVLEHCGGNVACAAKALGLQRPNLYRKLRALGLSPSGHARQDHR